MASIDELLKALAESENTSKASKLENNKDTWRRIQKKDSFSELGLKGSALDEFLKEWISDNPYSKAL